MGSVLSSVSLALGAGASYWEAVLSWGPAGLLCVLEGPLPRHSGSVSVGTCVLTRTPGDSAQQAGLKAPARVPSLKQLKGGA